MYSCSLSKMLFTISFLCSLQRIRLSYLRWQMRKGLYLGDSTYNSWGFMLCTTSSSVFILGWSRANFFLWFRCLLPWEGKGRNKFMRTDRNLGQLFSKLCSHNFIVSCALLFSVAAKYFLCIKQHDLRSPRGSLVFHSPQGKMVHAVECYVLKDVWNFYQHVTWILCLGRQGKEAHPSLGAGID